MGIETKNYDVFVRLQSEAVADNKGVGCCTGMENLLEPGEKKLKSKTCSTLPAVAGTDDNGKQLAKREYGNGSISYEFATEVEASVVAGTPSATDGRVLIWEAYESDEDLKLTITIEIDDGDGTAGTGTRYERDVLVSNVSPLDDGDGEYEEKAMLEFLGKRRMIPKPAGE